MQTTIVKIERLKELKENSYAGEMYNLLYKCVTLRPFIKYIVETKYSELTTKIDTDIYPAFMEWINLSEKANLDLIDSIVMLYKFNKIPYYLNKKKTIYLTSTLFSDYKDLFDDLTDYLLGEVSWDVDLNNKEAYVEHTIAVTAEWLTKIYERR